MADIIDVTVVEALMRELCLVEHDSVLARIAWEHIATGGKRLRARLAVSAVQAFGGNPVDGVAWGAACEFLHNASLIHDDIQDGDSYRRGIPSLWARHGLAQAINAGDLCITLGYAALRKVPRSSATRWQLTEVVTGSCRRVVEGQAAELALLTAKTPTFPEYASCVEGKTSALFSLPIQGAALIAGRSPAQAMDLVEACRPLGLLFQIQDDTLDLYGDNGRDLRGSDLAQSGKASVFIIEHLRLHPHDWSWLLNIVNAPREATSRAMIEEVIARFSGSGALQAVWERIDALCDNLEDSQSLRQEPPLRSLVLQFAATMLRPIEHTRPRFRQAETSAFLGRHGESTCRT